jgi:hypothetical protein
VKYFILQRENSVAEGSLGEPFRLLYRLKKNSIFLKIFEDCGIAFPNRFGYPSVDFRLGVFVLLAKDFAHLVSDGRVVLTILVIEFDEFTFLAFMPESIFHFLRLNIIELIRN